MFVPDPATAALKQELYTLCAGTRNGVDADAGRKQEIQRVVTELEVLGQQRWTEYQQQHTATTAEGNEQEQEQEAVTMTDVSLRGSRHVSPALLVHGWLALNARLPVKLQ